ncbi:MULTISPECIES: Dabb family protein [Flammeovirga]|uniref:Dabb family protein n=1 Tax=Flammeovirga agarivorans TaxID=2726742 RepID=A0A7X8SIV9_9BACT|nr:MULTISPECIES: Dabb family protein [Flammeovirga]NLR91034.1 Dabb family protein [Flammeovirga agarivorans]
MINHTVLFKIKDEATSSQVTAMINALNALGNKIEEIKEIHVKENFSDRAKGFSVVLYSIFETEEALNKYQVHPAHVEVVTDHVKPILEDILVADIDY